MSPFHVPRNLLPPLLVVFLLLVTSTGLGAAGFSGLGVAGSVSSSLVAGGSGGLEASTFFLAFFVVPPLLCMLWKRKAGRTLTQFVRELEAGGLIACNFACQSSIAQTVGVLVGGKSLFVGMIF